jgi:hypothetical protein
MQRLNAAIIVRQRIPAFPVIAVPPPYARSHAFAESRAAIITAAHRRR